MLTNLRLLRLKAGLTVRAAAKELGVHETWLSRIEKGRAVVPESWREKLAAYYKVPPEELYDPATGWPVLVDMPMPKPVRRQA